MIEGIDIGDPQLIFRILVAIATMATVFTIAMPLMERDTLDTRMRSVAVERDRIRAREREKLASRANSRASLRQEPKA